MHLVSIAPVAEPVAVAVCEAPHPQLRLQVPVKCMMQEPAVFVAHFELGPVVLEAELAVLVTDAEVAAGSVALKPLLSLVLPAEAVAV